MNILQNHVEALIFCASSPIGITEIRSCLSEMFGIEISEEDVEAAIQALITRYDSEGFSFHICQLAEGYQFLTKPAYQASIAILLKQKSRRRLSISALETMAIIAYKQPITKTEIEQIRGVNCDYTIQKLLEKELIILKGKAESPGRPLLYSTSDQFMAYFGINSLKDLPQPKDFAVSENDVGQISNE